MLGFLTGLATGYVLGTRDGRERYEQIVDTYRRIAGHPTVQRATETAKAKANEAVGGKPQQPQHAQQAPSAQQPSAQQQPARPRP